MQNEPIMPAGSKTCDSINASEEESDYKQGCGGKSCSDQAAECPTKCQGSSGEQAARGDTAPHCQQEYADGARPATRGELEAFRLRYARLE